MRVRLVSEEDDSDFIEFDLDDGLVEQLKTTFHITSEDELSDLLRTIIIENLKEETE